MSSSDRSRERRRWFRCPVRDPQQNAELELGSRRLPVRMLDESMAGFAVLAAKPPGLQPGDVARLRNESGRFEVQVADVVQVRSADTGSLRTAFRVGLLRLCELDPTAPSEENPLKWFLRLLLSQSFPSGVSVFRLVGTLALAAIVAFVAVALLLWSAGHLSPKPGSRRTSGTSTWSPSGSDARNRPQSLLQSLAADSKGATDSRQSPADASSSPRDSGQADSPDAQRGQGYQEVSDLPADVQVVPWRGPDEYKIWELRRTVRSLPGAAPFSLPEVVEELKLTDSQQQQMHELEHRSSEAMQEINTRWQGSSRQQISEIQDQVLEAARREALDILTDQQRARWMEIVGPEDRDKP